MRRSESRTPDTITIQANPHCASRGCDGTDHRRCGPSRPAGQREDDRAAVRHPGPGGAQFHPGRDSGHAGPAGPPGAAGRGTAPPRQPERRPDVARDPRRPGEARMNFTVVWDPAAEQELAELWINAPDRNAVTQAANHIDRTLQTDPEQHGESRPDGRRILIVAPLGV